MWLQFMTKCVWQPQHENSVNENFEKRARKRIKDTHFVARKGGSRPLWLHEDVWSQLLAKWNTEEWKQRSEQAKEKADGEDVSHATIFEETHKKKKKKKKKDGTREACVEPRSSEMKGITEEWRNSNKLSPILSRRPKI
ncbi:PREDICTED: uncharacterized protein LOC109230399 [Nicotiana attenuata]|uniref:uncharacterized protein LOC109230399 n=1 Tax=Nicotiana attenuata TaxID=49451 RepID=UPI00090528D8|nr:PREDICTED: uncharacterized protein LOC109230399 [Nicotiana attenuata]